jgi:hypothetical protein
MRPIRPSDSGESKSIRTAAMGDSATYQCFGKDPVFTLARLTVRANTRRNARG